MRHLPGGGGGWCSGSWVPSCRCAGPRAARRRGGGLGVSPRLTGDGEAASAPACPVESPTQTQARYGHRWLMLSRLAVVGFVAGVVVVARPVQAGRLGDLVADVVGV